MKKKSKSIIRAAYKCSDCLDVGYDLTGFHNSLPQWRFCLNCNGDIAIPEPDFALLDNYQLVAAAQRYVDAFCAKAAESGNWTIESQDRSATVLAYLADIPEPQRVFILRTALHTTIRGVCRQIQRPSEGNA